MSYRFHALVSPSYNSRFTNTYPFREAREAREAREGREGILPRETPPVLWVREAELVLWARGAKLVLWTRETERTERTREAREAERPREAEPVERPQGPLRGTYAHAMSASALRCVGFISYAASVRLMNLCRSCAHVTPLPGA